VKLVAKRQVCRQIDNGYAQFGVKEEPRIAAGDAAKTECLRQARQDEHHRLVLPVPSVNYIFVGKNGL